MPETSPWIAIVDDDPSVLRALSRLLSTRALSVKTFPSGQQFLNSLDDEVPDCLILDLQMPVMTGLELQQDLARRGIEIPTIVITARNEAETRERCASAGAIAFLPKPIDDASLFAAIELARQRRRDRYPRH